MQKAFDPDNFTASGCVIDGRRREECTLYVSDGKVSMDSGVSSDCDFQGIFVYDVLNAHTHCGDYGLKVPEGLSLEELVAPPDGLKHRYLRELDGDGLRGNIRSFCKASAFYGSAGFVDFREGGAEGCKVLRECCGDAVILGRPVSEEYDPEEMSQILQVADGIGLPSISDMPLDYIESVADDVRDARKILAIHVSERVREDIDAVLSLDPAFVVHMCEATDDDLAKCVEAEVPIVVCPTSNRYFGKEAPVASMIRNGADVALGTDNGMLCEPDMVKECGVMSSILDSQGADPGDAWAMLSTLSCKLLKHRTRMMVKKQERVLTIIPEKEDSGTSCNQGPGTPFRIRTNRVVRRCSAESLYRLTEANTPSLPSKRL